ncbi:GNAT family N-acetyltransferase [Eubacterium sp. MSJ-13]|uniref:GNAT family N-acetyltransferase n=1 Tax=Eubacterium sp. MSJ-13 TaxID=2841513 RepID=UPI001C0FF6FB|nr:GNAT family N-acetyltransferase [Eubacterium sp. MSJ-13]MBU5477633.1 GNAT family N-acetyltransferase [Eubacterium sp. MSJ-13]
MLRLRPYNKNDAKTIMSWIKDEKSFYKWTVGFFTMRRPNEFFEELRCGIVIVDLEKRRQEYGKKMLKLGLKYAREIFCVNKVSLGVFGNNKSAYYCYKSIGFKDVFQDKIEKYTVMGKEWNCLELEIKL